MTGLAIELAIDECMGQADLGIPEREREAVSDSHTIPDLSISGTVKADTCLKLTEVFLQI